MHEATNTGHSSTARPRRVAVVGAGAAGLMAAGFAAEGGAETLLIERTREGGKKILISGGGRCNILPAQVDETRFVTDSSPNTLRKILRSWPLREQIAFFEKTLNVPLIEEAGTRKLFPVSQRARDVRDALLAHVLRSGTRLLPEATVTSLSPDQSGWLIGIEGAPELRVDAIILATGGLSIPQTGSDGFGFRMARALGIEVVPEYPALTPVTTSDQRLTALSGIAIDVTLTASSAKHQATAEGAFLFTHRGYSGPTVLDVSHVIARSHLEGDKTAKLFVAWLSHGEDFWMQRLRPEGRNSIGGVLKTELPERLALLLILRAGLEPYRLLAQLKRDERRHLMDQLLRCELPWSGDEGYRKAEVTGGGVPLAARAPLFTEIRKHAGMSLCGEVLDVFGPIGGYNFYWAWATGRAAGIAAAQG